MCEVFKFIFSIMIDGDLLLSFLYFSVLLSFCRFGFVGGGNLAIFESVEGRKGKN